MAYEQRDNSGYRESAFHGWTGSGDGSRSRDEMRNSGVAAGAINGAITNKIYNGSTIQATTKTEVSAPAAWTADKFVNCTGSASSAGFTGRLFVQYVRTA